MVNNALNNNFHTTASADVTTISNNYDSLSAELMTALSIECVKAFWCGPNDLAYVRGAFPFIRRLMDINLCPKWFTCSNYHKRVSTVIHEVAHQYPGAGDKAYEWQTSYASLSSAEAIKNADSYAVAAREIYHGGSYGPGTVSC